MCRMLIFDCKGQALRPLVLENPMKDELRTMVEGFTIRHRHLGVMNGGDW